MRGLVAARQGEYQPIEADAEGVLPNEVFPGLHLNPWALLANSLAKALACVQAGTASDQHRAFVAQVAERTAKTQNQQ